MTEKTAPERSETVLGRATKAPRAQGAPLAAVNVSESAPSMPPPTPPGSSHEPAPVRTGRREEILDGAAEMFAEHGYHGSSLRDISSHIGISHSGMLHHFGSKDALLDGVIDRMEEHAQAALDRIHEMDGGRAVLLRGLAQVWHPASLPIRLLATLDAESVSEEHPGRYRLARLRRVHEHLLETCFTTMEEKGLLRKDTDPAFAGRALLGAVLNLAVREKTVRTLQHRGYDDAPLEDLAKQVEAFLRTDESEDSAPQH